MFTALTQYAADTVARSCLGLVICSLFLCCGDETESKYPKPTEENGTVILVPARGTGTSRLASIPISFQNSQNASNVFSLLESTAYTIQLTDCLSGYSTTVTEANVDGLEIYSYDRNCLAKLTAFTANGRNYIPTASDPFTTWQGGDSAIFDEAGEPGVAPIKIVVLSTLANPATATDQITFGWASIVEGESSSILWSTVGFSGQVQHLGNLPPSFSIKSIEFLGLTAGAGGRYKLVLECTDTIGITNVCESVDLADLDYKFVADTYGGSIDKTSGDTIFATAGDPVTLPDDRVAPGDSGTINGGFVTVVLDGPDDLALNPNMLFVIRSYEESFQFFNIDIAVSATY